VELVLCDGQRMLLDALAPALRAAGHVVSDVCDEPDTLPALVARRRPDVCLLEASYRGTTRLDAAAAVRWVCPATVVVLLTGEASAAVWQAFDDRMVDSVVSKSSSFDVVDSMIREAHQGRRQVTGFLRPPTRARTAERNLDTLTDRERQVLDLMVDGLSTLAMANRLGVSKNTVRTHVAGVLRKLSVHDRAKAVSSAVHQGIG
jgi:DNA-binding NarL/FixJ family response regulator